MASILSPEKARQRRSELLQYYRKMVEYAAGNGVDYVLIAGDLFDKRNVSATAKRVFLEEIENHPEIGFFYLKGNHDLTFEVENAPDNLYMFSEKWTVYELSDTVCLTGAQILENAGELYDTLVLDNNKINIVTLHGQIGEYNAKDKGEHIALSSLKNRGIDYLALGHVHALLNGKLDSRGIWCYPGCLQGRGFDECGEHGFVVIDIENRNLDYTFVKMNGRAIREEHLDVTGLDTVGIERLIEDRFFGNKDSEVHKGDVQEAGQFQRTGQNDVSQSMIRLVLEGSHEPETEIDTGYLERVFEDKFYLFRVKDHTTVHIDYRDYEAEVSLKGEFVRLVMADERLDEKRKSEIISLGLKAIAGEKL